MTFIIGTKNFVKSQMRSTNMNSPVKPLIYNATNKQENVGAI